MKYYNILQKFVMDKYSSFFGFFVCDKERKMFITFDAKIVTARKTPAPSPTTFLLSTLLPKVVTDADVDADTDAGW